MPRNSHLFTAENLDKTQYLLNLIARHRMKMALPQFLPTLKSHSTGNLTRVDNVFCLEHLLNSVIKCYVNEKNRPAKTDDFPIIMQIDMVIPKATNMMRRNFKEAEWDKMLTFINDRLNSHPHPEPITSTDALEEKINMLNVTVKEVIRKFVPPALVTPYTK